MPQIAAKTGTLVIGSLGFIASLATSLNVFTKSANAAYWCQCTQYVRNRFALTNNFPHAKDWDNGYLTNNGFVKTTPKVGAVVVMETSFPGANTTYGHVGVVQSIDSSGRITVRGANQSVGTTQVTEFNCTNVRSTQFATSINGRGDISFWQKGTTPTPPPPVSGLKTYFIGSFALNTNNNFVKLDGFPIMSSWTRNDSDPDQQFERLKGNWGFLLKHKSTGGCLNAHYLSNNSQMNVWSPCNPGDPDQNWTFPDLGNGHFHIKRAATNLNSCVDMPNRTNGGRIHMIQCDPNNANQRWRTN